MYMPVLHMFQDGYTCIGMVPVVDGPGGFLPQSPVDLRKSGSVMNGPIISGITEEDSSLFLPLCKTFYHIPVLCLSHQYSSYSTGSSVGV